MLEIRTQGELVRWLAEPELRPAAVLGLDLTGVNALESGRFDDSLFLSCDLTPAQAGFLTMVGATVIGGDDHLPFSVYRSRLYSPTELYAGFDPEVSGSYAATLDARIYDHFLATGAQFPTSLSESLFRRLHDFSIAERLREVLAGTRPVAVMGGHGVERADPLYRTVAEMTRSLTRQGFLILSGGGPGVMEAAHFGCWFAGRADAELVQAIDVMSLRPTGAASGTEYADPDWLARAFRVRKQFPDTDDPFASVGIPTWAYGHEPPAAFASFHAKFFDNSLREDGLLAAATAGVIFTPGSAGTVQEIFQDGAQNHYATFGAPSPMVLLDVDYWTHTVPTWPVLKALASGRAYESLLLLTDSPTEAIEFIEAYDRTD